MRASEGTGFLQRICTLIAVLEKSSFFVGAKFLLCTLTILAPTVGAQPPF